MSSFREKQSKFVKMIALLLQYADFLGYELTLGDCYRDDRCNYGASKSLHKSRLAIDLNLFKNDKWLTDTKDHEPLGLFWEFIGGSWGGRFGDGNHYSLEHNGRK